jgi:hypothetical protein
VISAAAECLAGGFIAGAQLGDLRLYPLALGAALIFAAGSLLGHFFDRTADARHFPERPLPSGRVRASEVWRVGLALLVLGVALSAAGGRDSLLAGVAVALVVAVHASLTKSIWGPGFITTGLARAANLLLGMTAAGEVLRFAPAALPVVLYATGWAVLRASRQPGAPFSTVFVAALHLVAGVAAALYLGGQLYVRWLDALPFLLLLFGLVFPRLVAALADPRRPAALEAVQYGFLGLLLLEAALAAGHSGFYYGAVVGLGAAGARLALGKWPLTLITTPR